MKKIVLSSLLLSAAGLATVPVAQADTHSVSVGYAQSRIEHFKDIRGVNLKYRYEAQTPLGLMASFSWQSGKRGESGGIPVGMSWRDDVKATYWSLMAGPAVRVNELVSLYVLAGAGTGRAEVKEHISMPGYNGRFTGSERRTGFAWGAGVQFNPVENVVIDLGYEGSKVGAAKLNGVNVGVGYRF
ncbi:outer membrane beta-barrel protein [Salmonella enterica]|nr:outer membrane beta-barrel protein [Salmonella enterica]